MLSKITASPLALADYLMVHAPQCHSEHFVNCELEDGGCKSCFVSNPRLLKTVVPYPSNKDAGATAAIVTVFSSKLGGCLKCCENPLSEDFLQSLYPSDLDSPAFETTGKRVKNFDEMRKLRVGSQLCSADFLLILHLLLVLQEAQALLTDKQLRELMSSVDFYEQIHMSCIKCYLVLALRHLCLHKVPLELQREARDCFRLGLLQRELCTFIDKQGVAEPYPQLALELHKRNFVMVREQKYQETGGKRVVIYCWVNKHNQFVRVKPIDPYSECTFGYTKENPLDWTHNARSVKKNPKTSKYLIFEHENELFKWSEGMFLVTVADWKQVSTHVKLDTKEHLDVWEDFRWAHVDHAGELMYFYGGKEQASPNMALPNAEDYPDTLSSSAAANAGNNNKKQPATLPFNLMASKNASKPVPIIAPKPAPPPPQQAQQALQQPDLPENFKTKICRYWEQNRCMNKKAACPHAHGEKDLRKKPAVLSVDPRYKSTICKDFVKPGGCPRSIRECHFAHGEDDLNDTVRPQYRTRMCNSLLYCKCIASCPYAHSQEELRQY